MSKTLAVCLREFNVRIVPNSQNYRRAARETCAGRTLARIFEMRGYEHLRSVVMSIVETRNNKKMLVAPVIWAISDVLMFRPDWFGDQWLQALDEIELAELFEIASATRRLGKPRAVVATMLFEKMRPRFPAQVQAGQRRPADQPAQRVAA